MLDPHAARLDARRHGDAQREGTMDQLPRDASGGGETAIDVHLGSAAGIGGVQPHVMLTAPVDHCLEPLSHRLHQVRGRADRRNLVRLATGCSWEDAERLCGNKVSDTTARSRRDEWLAAGVFDAIATQAEEAYDRVVGLDLSDVALDGSLHKSPCGGEGTGKNPTDRGKLGWKWSILTDRNGIPIGWAIEGANRNDSILLEATLDDAAERGLLADVETIWASPRWADGWL